MSKNDINRTFRNFAGWFSICVWIGGVPQVVGWAYLGIGSAYKTVKCELVDCSADREAQMGEFSASEWKIIMGTKEAQGILAKKKPQ